MENIGNRNLLLSELSGGNLELGQAFAMDLNNMVLQSGIRNPKAPDFVIMPPSWEKLANKSDKTDEENKKLASEYNDAIRDLAKSYLLFIARETGNMTGKIDYSQFEAYMRKYRFGHYTVMNKPEYLSQIIPKIRTAFDKICARGAENHAKGTFIDKESMAVFLYALTIMSKRDENNQFVGFKINGIISPREYCLNETLLFREDDNMFSVKLRIAEKMLNNK